MKAKTIKAVLTKKHRDFVMSISDEKVRELVRKNSIITGGSIVSMLLGEQVNDFDYYFTDKETALAVATYYVDKFNKDHNRQDISVSLKEETGRIAIYVPSAGVAGDDNEEVLEETTEFADCGLDDTLNLSLDELRGEAEKQRKPYRPIFLSTNAISLSGKIQLVIRFYGDAEQIHENYDFVHCTCYWTAADNNLVLPQKALEAILTKELIYTGSKYPLCSIIRTRKFVERGWKINAGQFVKMCWQLHELDLKNIDVLREQLTGVDSAYFLQAITILQERKEKDPTFELTEPYLFEIINRIF